MEPSFRDGDQLVVNPRAYRRSAPNRGDVAVVCDPRLPARKELKRIVGLAGEEVRLEDGLLHVDGAVLGEPYLAGLPSTLGLEARRWRMGPDEYFVMGDNRTRSTDSREYGPVKRRPAGRQGLAEILAAPALGSGTLEARAGPTARDRSRRWRAAKQRP